VSDLTNPTKRWSESHRWALLVYEEFFVQGDRETELGIPVSSMTDRKNTNIATEQFGFIDFVIKPTFEVFSAYLPSTKIHLDNLVKNRKRWEAIVDDCDKIKAQGNDLIKIFDELNDCEEEEDEESPRKTLSKTKEKKISWLGAIIEGSSEDLSHNLSKNSPIILDNPTNSNHHESENNA
jgi:hypothetical protein